MLDDLKSAVRFLKKSPGFTAVALAVLALGIGASTAIFSVVDAVFLRGLPFDEHDRIVAVLEHDPLRASTFGDGTTTSQMYLDWRREQKPFELLCAVGGMRFQLRNEQGEPDEAWGQLVSWEFFPTLRVSPFLGRAFTAEDEIWGRHRSIILSYGAWQRRFGGAADVVGKTVQLGPGSEEAWVIVGVMPPDFSYPVGSARPAEMLAPLAFREGQRKREGGGRTYNWRVMGRLRDGVTLAQANDQMVALAAALDAQYPTWSPGRRARVIPLHEHLVGRTRMWMLFLLGAVALVQLIACANVANLMLARAATRTKEMAVRAALGAGRGRLLRSLLVESVVLSLVGAGLGILLASHGVDILRAWLPANVPRVADIAIDLRVLGMAVGLGVATGIIFGMMPALQLSRPDLVTALKEGSRSATTGTSGQRLRNILVVSEVALAAVLLIGAGLFIGSFARLMAIDLGFDYQNLLTVEVNVRIQGGDFRGALKRGGPYAQQMLEAVSAAPGVEAVGAVSGGLPLSGGWSRSPVTLPGRGELAGDGGAWEDNSIDRRIVTPNYHQLLRIPLRRGRYLSELDHQGVAAVVVINEAAAGKYWPGEEALGKRITIEKTEYIVVGVVGDIRHLGPETRPRQEAYLPLGQSEVIGVALVMRTMGDPFKALPAVKSAIWSVNPDQRLFTETVTLEAHLDRLIAQRRFNMALLGLLGAMALVIAVAGIYGVMAYVVAQRTAEIGVRMALGATRGDILGMVLRRAVLLVASGLLIGGTAAWYASAALRSFLFEMEPNDVRTFALVLAVLALAGLLASMVPAQRASRIDPMVALRHE